MRGLAERAMTKQVSETLAWLEKRGSKKNRDGLARYGIVADKVYGVSVATIRAKGRSSAATRLALALWDKGGMKRECLRAFVDDPAQAVVPDECVGQRFRQLGSLRHSCFHLVRQDAARVEKSSSGRPGRRIREARSVCAFAGVGLHDKKAPNEPFVRSLALIEKASTDERNFVKKGVSWRFDNRSPKRGATQCCGRPRGETVSVLRPHVPLDW